MTRVPEYKIFSLGDSALTLDFGNTINTEINDRILSLFQRLQQQPLPGMTEAVPAYSSLTIFYDVWALHTTVPASVTVFEWMKKQLQQILHEETGFPITTIRQFYIPVCYDKSLAPDLEWASAYLKIPEAEIIRLHTLKNYRVYMLGFLPGFAYMGEVDDLLALPRKKQPVPVRSGDVGIAGRQTAVYPLSSPGGWQIIGKTPVKMFAKEENPFCVVQPGDQVKFYPIGLNEFIFLQNNPSLLLEKGLHLQHEFENFKIRNT